MQYSLVAATLVAAVYADYGYSSAIPVYGVYSSAAAAPLAPTTPALPVYYTTPSAVASPVLPSAPVYYSAPAYSSSSSVVVAPVLSSAIPAPVYTTPVAVAPHYTTEIVTALTTYCPEATELTHGTKTYTVTEATTLTITDCPCTITKSAPALPTSTKPASKAPLVTPVPTAPAKVTSAAPKPACPSGVVSQIGDGQPQAPVDCTVAPAPKFTTVPVAPVAPSVNATKPATKPTSAHPKPATYTGAASKVTGAGAGLAAVFGVVAYLL